MNETPTAHTDDAQRIRLSAGTLEVRDLGPRPSGEGADAPSGPPTLVFVHGALVDGSLWSDVAERLRSRFRCIVPTWPLGSHRFAMDPDADLSWRGLARLVAELLEKLDLDDVTLVANDSGGALAQLVAVHHPERVAGLVLTNCDAFEVFPPMAYRYMGVLARVPGALTVVAKEMHALPILARAPLAFGSLARRRIPGETLKRWLRPGAKDAAVRRDTRKVLRGIHPSVTLEAGRRLADFEGRTLIAWGEDDPFFRLELAERLQRAFRRAELEVIPEARTFVALDQPEALADAISRFELHEPVMVRRSA